MKCQTQEQERLNNEVWRPYKESFHPYNRLFQGKQTTDYFYWKNLSTRRKEDYKVHLWDKMHIWLIVISYVEAKSQIRRCTVHILLLYCYVFLLVLYNIHFWAAVSVWSSCLHQHFLWNKYTSIYIWNSSLYRLPFPACFTTANLR